MTLSVIVSGDVQIARDGQPNRDRLADGSHPTGADPPMEQAPNIMVVRRGGADHRRGEILGYLATTKRAGAAAPKQQRGDVFLIELKLHPDLSGFTPGAHRVLIALAVTRLAWTEANHEDIPALVVVRICSANQRLREDLTMLRASRLPHPIAMQHGLFAMSGAGPNAHPVEYWQVTPEMAQQCARLLQLEPDSPDPWRIDRLTGIRQQLRLTLDMRWLKSAGGMLDALAETCHDLAWGPLPENDVGNPPDPIAEREWPDGDPPTS